MLLKFDDWVFDVDLDETMLHSAAVSRHHCTCDYCRNFYKAVNQAYPELQLLLTQFGLDPQGPDQLMPFEPTLCLAFYHVRGRILHKGSNPFYFGTVQCAVTPEERGFILEIGELEVPWLLECNMDEVLSPANEPEFLSQMRTKWLERQPVQVYLS